MKNSHEVTPVRINPHIVGWYLINELKKLKKLKQCEEEQLSQLNHPLYAKTIDEIYVFAAQKKRIEWPLKCNLQGYKRSFDADDFLRFEEIVDYFEEQLTALNTQKTIDKIIVDVAYAAHEHAEKNHLIDAAKMGQRLFKTVVTIPTVEERLQVSGSIIKEKQVVSSNNSAVTSTQIVSAAKFMPLPEKKAMGDSTLSGGAASFIPFSQRNPMADSIDDVDIKRVTPQVISPSPRQDLINSSATQRGKDEPIENSRLYRFYVQVPQTTNTTPLEDDFIGGLVYNNG